MKLLKSFLVSFLLYNLLYAQTDRAVNDESYTAVFYLDALNYKLQDTTASRVDVFVQVPYSNIQFIKEDNRYAAKYEVTLTLFDEEKKNTLWNEVWQENVTSDNFNQTLSSNNFNLSLESSRLEPNDYVLRCILEDLNSRKSTSQEYKMHVKSFGDSVSVSDILLIEKIKETSQGERIIPNISRTIASLNELLPFYYEIYSDKAKPVSVVYEVKENTKETFSDTVKLQLKKGVNEITEKLKYPKFSFGNYNLFIRVCDTSQNILSETSKSFFAQILGIPGTITDLDLAVRQMIYIAEPDEINKIKEAGSYGEKLQRYLEYWRLKDPTPGTPLNEVMLEYYRRVNYANKTFGGQSGDGWRTDMGMVYITLGQPDNVESHPFNMDSKPYEIWSYYNYNRTFLFIDYNGFGDYRLVNNNYYELNKYRY